MTRRDTDAAVMLGDDGADTEPIEPPPAPPPPRPEPEPEPVRIGDAPAESHTEPEPAEPEAERPGKAGPTGIPAGQIAIGALATLTVGGVGLYQLAGTVGLLAGGAAVAGCGAIAYRVRNRRSSSASSSGEASASGRTRRRGSSSGFPGLELGSIGRTRRARRAGGAAAGAQAGSLAGRGRSRGRARPGDPAARAGVRGPSSGVGSEGTRGRRASGLSRLTSRAAAARSVLGERAARARARDVQTVAALRSLLGWIGRKATRRPPGQDAQDEQEQQPGEEPAPSTTNTETAASPNAAPETSPSDSTAPATNPAPTNPAPTHRGAPVSQFALINQAIEMGTIASAFESEDMMDVKAFLEQLHELPLGNANAIRIFTDRLAAEYPLHQDVIETLRRLYEGFAALTNEAAEVASTFNQVHAREIQRRLTPRVGEQKWNNR
ncbi:hypothetical protein ACQP25_44325 (plasmid) [Microtetraspora malaysiensis]|uniref:hypothetical protein n=1 Tax=Microtetraspora malaysiensis TaxID=161358 RepID=UPI003D8BC69B